MDDLTALVVLNNLPHFGPIKIRQIVQHFGSPVAALEAAPSEVERLPGFGEKLSASLAGWRDNTRWQEDLALVERDKVSLIPYWDPAYPISLNDLSAPPSLLYIRGTLIPADRQAVGIVGTRDMTIYGGELAERFGRDLAGMGITIVSGLARGIDTRAHSGALATGRTLAVIGSGLARLYPPENAALAAKISHNGAVISEFPMATPPDRQHFPYRNRVVGALSSACVLIEAPIKSGAMITMGNAHSLGRPTFALPGRVDMTSFEGNHHLIKTGKAQLAENPRDIVSIFDTLFGQLRNTVAAPAKALPLDPEEQRLFDAMPCQELNIDELAALTFLTSANLAALLMSLVLKKRVKQFPGKIYKKVNA